MSELPGVKTDRYGVRYDKKLPARLKVEELIHLKKGWTKVPWPQRKGQDTVGCEQGWAWRSPGGSHYEGHMGMVNRYADQVDSAVVVLREIVPILTGMRAAQDAGTKWLEEKKILEVVNTVEDLLASVIAEVGDQPMEPVPPAPAEAETSETK